MRSVLLMALVVLPGCPTGDGSKPPGVTDTSDTTDSADSTDSPAATDSSTEDPCGDGEGSEDLDGDGARACEDCDAADPQRYPGAAETCGDGAVQDCDSSAEAAYARCGPTGDVSLSDADAVLGGAAGDQAGDSVAGARDLDGDGYGELMVGATQSDACGRTCGAVYVVHGPVTGDGSLKDAAARLIGVADQELTGSAVAGAGDTDGDGSADLLASAMGADVGVNDNGSVYLVRGPVSGDLSMADADARLLGEDFEDLAGVSVAGGGPGLPVGASH